jgi:hypothetical protein
VETVEASGSNKLVVLFVEKLNAPIAELYGTFVALPVVVDGEAEPKAVL